MSLPDTARVALVTSDVQFYDKGTVPGASAQLKFTERRKNQETGEYEDGRVLWIWAKAWRGAAQKLNAAGKSSLVFVQGETVTEQWQDKQTGEQREKIVLHVRELEQLVKGGANETPRGAADGSWTPTQMPAEQPAAGQQDDRQREGANVGTPAAEPFAGGTWPEAAQPGNQGDYGGAYRY